jgi:hypothetical protein
VPANIDLCLTLPDGKVTTRRDYPMDQELRSMSDPARQADEREWTIIELPGAIAQLYARAGIEPPPDAADELRDLRSTVAKLAETFPESARETYRNFYPKIVVRDVIDRIARLAGDADELGRHLDAVKDALGLIGEARDNVADADVADHVKALAVAATSSMDPEGAIATQVLLNMLALHKLPHPAEPNANEIFLSIAKAEHDKLERARDEGRREALADLARTFQLKDGDADPSELPERLLGLYGQQRRIGQLDVLRGLGVEGDELPADADLPQWGPRTREAWFAEARQPLQAELDVARAYLALVLKDLKLVGDKHFEQVRTGELAPDALAGVVRQAQGAVASLHQVHEQMITLVDHFDLDRLTPDGQLAEKIIEVSGAEASRLRFEVGTLLDFFGLPETTADEAIAARVVKATTTAIQNAAEGARANERKAGPDVEEGARQRWELDKLLMHFGLPGDTSTVEIARRIIDDLRAAHTGTEGDVTVLRATLSLAGELAQAVTPMEGAALREGKVTGEALASMAREVQSRLVTRHGELAVLRNFAFEVAQVTGMTTQQAGHLTSGELSSQELANRLRPVKADLRADGAAAERDASRRILDAVKGAMGDPEAGDTLLPGAVRAQARDLLAVKQTVDNVRAVLVELGDASVQDRPDADLPGLVRLTVLTERFPIGATVEMPEGDIGVVHGVSAFLTDEMPLQVLFENGSTTWVSADQIRGVEYSPMSGVFKLPEGGLSGIFAKAKERAPKLPSMDKIDEVADRVADRIETWGERVASRINSAADKLAAEIDDAVENARKEGGK